ncbi:hypothetical protein QJQ45_018968, partial [Haematococcus lacustris]
LPASYKTLFRRHYARQCSVAAMQGFDVITFVRKRCRTRAMDPAWEPLGLLPQVKEMEELQVDRTGWRDPDPDSGINTAGTVTGTIDEFAKGDTPSNAGPEFRAAKQAYADSIGYSQEEYRAENQAKPGAGVTDALNAKMASSEEGTKVGAVKARSTVESVGQRVKEFVGETIETLKTGVNNAGQTGVREKL